MTVAGPGVILTRPSANAASASIGAPVDASYLVLTASAQLTSERVFAAGPGIKFTDTGPNGTLTAELNMQFNEIPSGSADGSNGQFGLLFAPTPSGSLMLHKNGLFLAQAPDCDYIVSGSVITFNAEAIPRSGSNIFATYIKP